MAATESQELQRELHQQRIYFEQGAHQTQVNFMEEILVKIGGSCLIGSALKLIQPQILPKIISLLK